MTKNQLRRNIRHAKLNMSLENRLMEEREIFKKIESLLLFKKSDVILLYHSLKDEVSTTDFIEKWKDRKDIYLPVIDGNNLRIHKYCGVDKITRGGMFGIWEPIDTPQLETSEVDLFIIPGMAFDTQRNRLGRGRGFYDRLLSKSKASTIGICYDFQIVEEVPTEPHDKSMDFVVSGTKYYSTSGN